MSKTLKLNTHDFCEGFKIPEPDELHEDIMDRGPEVTDKEIEEMMSENDIEDTDENRELMADAIRFTYDQDTGDALYREWKNVVGEILETFQDYPYEYFVEGEFKSYSGRTEGVLSYEISPDSIVVTVADDFGHIINDCLSGYGLIDPEEPGDNMPVEYMETRFQWLSRYWEIYGENKPKMGSVDYEWSKGTFKDMLIQVGLK